MTRLAVVACQFGVFEEFHAYPGHDNPDPRHNDCADHQCGIVARDGQSGVVFELGRRIRRLPNIPRPAPHTEAGAHAHHKHQPGGQENHPAPPFRLAVVPVVVQSQISGRLHYREGDELPRAMGVSTLQGQGRTLRLQRDGAVRGAAARDRWAVEGQ